MILFRRLQVSTTIFATLFAVALAALLPARAGIVLPPGEFELSGSAQTFEADLTGVNFPPGPVPGKYSSDMVVGTDRVVTIANPPVNNDFYFVYNNAALGGAGLAVATYRYVEVSYTLGNAFTGSIHQLRLATTNETTAVEPFTNDDSIPASAGTHTIIIDLLTDDGVTFHNRWTENWNLFRWNFWNNAGNENKSFTLDKIRFASAVTPAGSTIDTTDRHAWGENVGWTNWRRDIGMPGAGATIGQFYCAGLIFGENVGWIKLGTGAPADGIQYGNTDASDFGVNHDGAGKLTGLAWGENIGWLKFEQTQGQPRIDFATGEFSGYAWGENVGWINLGNGALPALKTETIEEGPDLDGDMLADAWELEQAANAGLGAVLTHLDKTTDSDGDGESDFFEYLADSNPFDIGDSLRIVAASFENTVIDNISLEWTSSPRRLYDIGSSTNLNPFTIDFPDISPDPGTITAVMFTDTPLGSRKFWRISAKLPLAQ